MTPTISVIVDGVEHALSEIGSLIAHDGWGMAPLHRLESRGSEQHGLIDEGYRLDARLADLVFRLPGGTLDDLYAQREAALRLFSPLAPIILKWSLGSGVRYIDCEYYGDLSMDWSADDWAAPKLAVTLRAADPTFYDPAAVAVTFVLGGGSDTGAVPTPVPTGVGASSIDASQAITYPGTWQALPELIRVTGPITNFVLSNEITGDAIRAKSGVSIGAGHYYDIDPRYGEATVLDDTGANVISNLQDDDDLTVFHLAAAPEAPGGVNVLRLTGSGVNSATKLELTYFVRYLGR